MTEMPELTTFQVLVTADAIRLDSPFRGWAQRRYDAVRGLVASLVREGIDRGEIRADADPEREGRELIAFLDGIRLQCLLDDRVPLGEVVAGYFDEVVGRLGVGWNAGS